MAHPYHHALSSVKKWGGTVDDFIAVHAWFSIRARRSLLTSGTGRFATMPRASSWPRRSFGPTLTLSTGRVIPTRWVGEQHVKEDLGFIPSFSDWVKGHPARTLDGPVRTDRGAGGSVSRLARGRGHLR